MDPPSLLNLKMTLRNPRNLLGQILWYRYSLPWLMYANRILTLLPYTLAFILMPALLCLLSLITLSRYRIF